MSLEIFALVLIVIGIGMSFKLKGAEARRARKWFAIGIALSLGGCYGTFSWLDAETSGVGNFANSINPYFWAGMFVFGFLVMAVNSVQVIRARAQQKQQESEQAPIPDRDQNPDGDQGTEGSREF